MFMVNHIILLLMTLSVVAVQGSTIAVTSFKNDTDITYVVHVRSRLHKGDGGPIYMVPGTDWVPTLVLRPKEKGDMNVVVRDEGHLGSQVRLVPLGNVGKTFYLRSGLQESGNCVWKWLTGPYSFIVTENESFFDNFTEHLSDVDRIRICSYREALVRLTILPDRVTLENEHNARILDI
jgi:hypothetical protein